MPERPALREVTQQYLADDPTGVPGDCVRAAVASLLDREPHQVPHFIAGDFDGRVWWYALKGWAATNGWAVTRRGLLPRQENVPLPTFGLACGPSERGHSHAVVAVDGEIVWDPHPSRAGILRVKEVIEFEPTATPGTFAWGQSVSLNKTTGNIYIPFNDGDDYAGDVQLGIDDIRVLRDMLNGALDEPGGSDA